MANAATPKQAALITKLVAERNPRSFAAPLVSILTALAAGQATAGQASWAITTLIATPKIQPKAPEPKGAPATPGFYAVDGTVFKVKTSKTTGKPYAMKLELTDDGGKWVYSPGTVHGLTQEQRLTLEQAKELGHETGVCMICGRLLSDKHSVELGIGPVCIKKAGL